MGLLGLGSSQPNLDEIKEELRQQTQMLKALQQGLNELKRQIEHLQAIILQAIVDAEERTKFSNRVSNLNQNVAVIQAFADDLRKWSNEEPNDERQKLEIIKYRDQLLNPANVKTAMQIGSVRQSATSAGCVGYTMYTVDGSRTSWSPQNFTNIDSEDSFTTPLENPGFDVEAVHVVDELVYLAGYPSGQVAVYNVSFPIGQPPELTTPPSCASEK